MRVMKPSLQITRQLPSPLSPASLAIRKSQYQPTAARRMCSGATFCADAHLTHRSFDLQPECAGWLNIPLIPKDQLSVSCKWRPYQSGGEHTRPTLCKGVAYASLN